MMQEMAPSNFRDTAHLQETGDRGIGCYTQCHMRSYNRVNRNMYGISRCERCGSRVVRQRQSKRIAARIAKSSWCSRDDWSLASDANSRAGPVVGSIK